MKYLCLVYLADDKLNAVPDRECMNCGEDLKKQGLLLSAEPLFPVETAKITSPSSGEKTGLIARAMPALAITATRFACGAVRIASVATMQGVVCARTWPFMRATSSATGGEGSPCPPYSRCRS